MDHEELSQYLKSNSDFHRNCGDVSSGPHSYPCAAWDHVQHTSDKFIHMFAHGMFPKNWRLVYRDFDV